MVLPFSFGRVGGFSLWGALSLVAAAAAGPALTWSISNSRFLKLPIPNVFFTNTKLSCCFSVAPKSFGQSNGFKLKLHCVGVLFRHFAVKILMVRSKWWHYQVSIESVDATLEFV